MKLGGFPFGITQQELNSSSSIPSPPILPNRIERIVDFIPKPIPSGIDERNITETVCSLTKLKSHYELLEKIRYLEKDSISIFEKEENAIQWMREQKDESIYPPFRVRSGGLFKDWD